MINILRDKKGATSVLVIFMMIVLVVFATLAFTTSYANYRLSQKAAAIKNENYALENLAMHMVLKIDTCLAQAEEQAKTAILGNPMTGQLPGVSPKSAVAIQEAADLAGAKDNFLTSLINRAYLHYAYEGLLAMQTEYEGLQIILADDYATADFFDFSQKEPTIGSMKISVALTTGSEKGDKQLDVLLEVEPCAYVLHTQYGSVVGRRAPSFIKRYNIFAWKQWQIPFTYDDSLEFGDASVIQD